MSVFNFKKKVSILGEEENNELREIEKKAYMEEAKKLIEERGKQRAKADLTLKKDPYTLN